MGFWGKLFGKEEKESGKKDFGWASREEGLWGLSYSQPEDTFGGLKEYSEVGRFPSEEEARADMVSLSESVGPGTRFIITSPIKGQYTYWETTDEGKLRRA